MRWNTETKRFIPEVDARKPRHRAVDKQIESARNKIRYVKNRQQVLEKRKLCRLSDPDGYREYLKQNRRKLRREVIEAYGGACVCCGEKEFDFLCIDHINDDGYLHRREMKSNIIHYLRMNNYPPGFQILCHNCNMAKAFVKICPHKR